MHTPIIITRIGSETLESAVERTVREICAPHGTVSRVTVTRDNAAGGRSGVAIADLLNPGEISSVASQSGALIFGSGALFFFREDA